MIRLLSISVIAILISCQSDAEWFSLDERQDENLVQDGNLEKSNSTISSMESEENELSSSTVTNLSGIPELLFNSSVTILTKNRKGEPIGQGSGAFIDNNKIVTNYHVIENGDIFEIELNSGNNAKFKASVFKIDMSHDIAILEIDTFFSEKVLRVNKTYPRIGEDIIVAGTPLGLNGTISKGNISAIRKIPPEDFDLFQISAPISPGSSGGPVVNTKGELIAISVAGVKKQGAQNLNFAVPVKYISILLE